VLLTVRSNPELWYSSVAETVASVKTPRLFGIFFPFARMVTALVWDGVFHGRFSDKKYAISIYEKNIEEVKKIVPPEQLLVFEAKQGWGPLCKFLDRPVPDKPFPHLNDRETMKANLKKFRNRKVYMVVAVTAAIVAVAGAFFITIGR